MLVETTMASTLQSNSPGELSTEEVDEFQQAILDGGEVDPRGLRDRVMSARSLVLLREVNGVAAIAALKSPVPTYRKRVAENARVELAVAHYPFELGWIFVYPFARNRHLSYAVSREALKQSDGRGVFATSRADNVAMHATLMRLGFEPAGIPFISRRGGQELQLFLCKGKCD